MAKGNPKPDHGKLAGTSPVVGPELQPGEATKPMPCGRSLPLTRGARRRRVVKTWFHNR